MKENLYFIALIPQQRVSEEITIYKNDFATRFASKKALKVMPHITIKSPFRFPPDYHHHLIKWFASLYITEKPFEIELRNFGAFDSRKNPVVYVDAVMNMPLYTLQNEIIRSFKNSYPTHIQNTDLKFKPHITIAYRDLTPGNFREAWKEYKHKVYNALVDAGSFHLLQHNTKQWNVIETIHLK